MYDNNQDDTPGVFPTPDAKAPSGPDGAKRHKFESVSVLEIDQVNQLWVVNKGVAPSPRNPRIFPATWFTVRSFLVNSLRRVGG